MKEVTFKKENITMSGNLYLPEDFDESQKYKAVVCSHPAGGVKEQTAGLYAQKLAENGYIALAFDAAYQGASGGEPRLKEDPNSRSTDVSFAVDYLQSLPYVDADNIAGLGVCAGGGYTLEAAKRDHRIKAVVTISGADYGAVLRRGWEGHGDPTSATGLLNAVAQSRKAEAMGTKPAMAQYIPEKLEDIVLAELKEGHEYYKTPRCMHPNSQGTMTFSSLANIVAFDTTANLSVLLMQPTLMIAGSKAGTLWISKEWNNLIKGKKQLVQIEGASHFDLYDRKAEEVTKAIIPFLKEYL